MEVQRQQRVSVSPVCATVCRGWLCFSHKVLTQPHAPQAGACTSASEQSFPLAELPTDALTCVLSKLPLGQLLAASTVRSSELFRSLGLGFLSSTYAIVPWLAAGSSMPHRGLLCPILGRSCGRCALSLHCTIPVSSLLGSFARCTSAKSFERVGAGQQAVGERGRGGVPGHLQRQQVGCAAAAARHRGYRKALSMAHAVQARKLLRYGGGVFHALSNAASVSSWGGCGLG